MFRSSCTVSLTKNDLQRTRLLSGKCPVKNCTVNISDYKVPYQRFRGRMIYIPFCPEHGIRVHKSGFVYYNGPSQDNLVTATKRNLPFHSDYYASNFFKKGAKMESGRLCYESSEDAVSYNVFAELVSKQKPLRKLVSHITGEPCGKDVELYLWGGKIDLVKQKFEPYKPLLDVRKHLEGDIRNYATEPDIMLVVPKKYLVCIEAKFGSKNPVAYDKEAKPGEKPKRVSKLIDRYCSNNRIIDCSKVFSFGKDPKHFYDQLFRNLVFAASMSELSGIPKWYVVNLRNQHVMNMKRGEPESSPVLRYVRAILTPAYKKRFSHLTWEQIHDVAIKDELSLANLSWYMRTKSLGCSRAFNIF